MCAFKDSGKDAVIRQGVRGMEEEEDIVMVFRGLIMHVLKIMEKAL